MKAERKMLPEEYRICMYLRLSNEDREQSPGQKESGSISSQRKLIQGYIKSHKEFERCAVIERLDDGLSGRYFDSRPGFTDMIDLCRKGKINCIIVKDCSRFGRNYVELGDYLEQVFPFLGVRFISVNDHYDSAVEEGGLDIAFRNLVYDYYSRDLSKKEKIAKTRMAEQGKYGAAQAMYGYRKKADDKHSLEIDPVAAAIVREVFAMRLAGKGPAIIARELNERGIPSPTEYRLKQGLSITHKHRKQCPGWIPSQVGAMLQNEGYTGAVVSHRNRVNPVTGKVENRPRSEWIVIPDMHEAIISKEVFNAVQSLKKEMKAKKSGHVNHYTCGICGRRLKATCACYYCTMKYVASDSDCAKIWVRKKDIDSQLLSSLQEKLSEVRTQRSESASQEKEETGTSRFAALQEQLQQAEREKRFLFEKLVERSIDRENFKVQKEELEEKIHLLRERISSAAGYGEIETRDQSDQPIPEITELKDSVWDEYIESAEVFPDGHLSVKFRI